MIRLLIGLALGAVMFLIGLGIFAGGMDLMDRRGYSDDVTAAIVVGGLLIFASIVVFWASVKAHKRRKAIAAGQRARGVDRGEAEGVMMGIGMAHMMNADDFDGSDDGGGDFGD